MIDASDDIDEHRVWLHSDDPMAAREYVTSKRGVTIAGAAHVLGFKKAMLNALANPTKSMEEAKAQAKRLQQGEVTDFRGEPLIDIASLSGQAVDHSVLDLRDRPSKEPSIRHKRTNHHN